ncbi:LytR/AlgR family response regulator transcription factor [Hymenobacter sp. CRA2]|uniref:LytR/AlgR family response regulator transcription factor n=1 Tax=Hymenobacter sp. CRA2 TaxID=1955620 RepID=UPI00098F2703|nr:LytTR family DNA-binding domain-containing protein [Hymenobacter sp. CRA2]OON69675.1 DNA-binding response regulator [Hymenobacter sp. CRA2]
MKLNCLILDDEPLARELLVEFIKKVPFLHVQATCSSSLQAMEILRAEPVDVLFLDVQMPELTGLELLKVLPRKPLVVLTTAYSKYALESYEFDTVDYLLKPITLERFLRAVQKLRARVQSAEPEAGPGRSSSPFLFVKDGVKLVKVRWTDILYVEGLRDYVTIHTRDQKIVSLQRLKLLEQQLPAEQFVRIHQSFIVSLEGIQAIHKDKVQVAGERFLPISISYRKSFKEFIDRNFLQAD